MIGSPMVRYITLHSVQLRYVTVGYIANVFLFNLMVRYVMLGTVMFCYVSLRYLIS